MNDYDKTFLNTFNESYPFERYIFRTLKPIGTLYDDALLSEIFVPNTKIEPIIGNNGQLIDFTRINPNEVYVKLLTKVGEIKFGYFDFNSTVRENIRDIFMDDFGGYEYECLYVEHEDIESLARLLNEQKALITGKYGECVVKREKYITSRIHL